MGEFHEGVTDEPCRPHFILHFTMRYDDINEQWQHLPEYELRRDGASADKVEGRR